MIYTDCILVTGGSGFIGSHLVDLLIEKGYSYVISMDRESSSTALFRNSKCIYLKGDITQKESLAAIFNKHPVDYIFHFSGNSNVPLSNEQPFLDFESNALGTLNLFQTAKEFNVKKIIFTSSASVYGSPITVPVTESHPLNPISNYALTKLYGEKLTIAYNQSYELNSSVLRIFSTYGPRQPRYVIYDTLKKLNSNPEKLDMLGNPDTIRDYIYVKDTVQAFYTVMKSDSTNGEVFNLSGGHTVSILELVQLICKILAIEPVITFSGKTWKGDIKVFNADISKLKQYTGFVPNTHLEEGLRETIEWFKLHEFHNL